VFSSDRRIGGEGTGEHGAVLDGAGELDPGLSLTRLSEEHGWLSVDPGHDLRVGDRLRIVPAHACTSVNLSPWLWVVEGERVLERWPVSARGLVA
jgi:D-serine deaminase-like pyridoxal phosphate-dependent protein